MRAFDDINQMQNQELNASNLNLLILSAVELGGAHASKGLLPLRPIAEVKNALTCGQ
jgi:hypothetical protein